MKTWKIAIRFVPLVLALGVMFGAAGRLDLPWFWALIGVQVSAMAAILALVGRDTLAERMKPGLGARPGCRGLMALAFVGCLAVAGLDAGRFGWTGELPAWVHLAGLAGVALGLGGWV